jgi:hypothetical protein
LQDISPDRGGYAWRNEITQITARAWEEVENKENCFIFCNNYGKASAISIIGKKHGLPEPVSFCESFKYWFSLKFKNDIKEIIYVISSDALESGNFCRIAALEILFRLLKEIMKLTISFY